MKKDNSGKKLLERICYVLLLACVYFLIGFIIVTIAKSFFGYEDVRCMITLIMSILLGIHGILIGRKIAEKVKKLRNKEMKELMKKQITIIAGCIAAVLVISIICTIKKSYVETLICLLFIVSLLIWELGAYLGYLSLGKKRKSNKKK